MTRLIRMDAASQDLVDAFDLGAPPTLEAPAEARSREPFLIVRGPSGRRTTHLMSWGFPRQTPTMETPKAVTMVADLTNPMWSGIAPDPRYRCLIPLTGFAEAAGRTGAKTRSWFSLKGQPLFAWAGLCRNTEAWGPVFAGLSTDSNVLVAPLNPRMPVLLHRDEHERWLTGDIREVIVFQFRPTAPTRLELTETDEPWVGPGRSEPEQPLLF